MSRAIDPVGFVMESLAARGALVEAAPGGAMALVPPETARALGLAEETRLALDADGAGAVGCGLGSPLLERLVAEARAEVPVASLRIDLEAPRAAQVSAAAERFVVRNGVCEFVGVTGGEATYVLAIVSYAAEADDRWEGTFNLVVESTTGGEPDAEFASLLDPARSLARRSPVETAPVPAPVASRIARRAELAAAPAIASMLDGVARRQARDRDRIVEYFDALIGEARAPRRRTDGAAIAAKVAQLIAERDAKVRDLAARYAVRVTLAPAALVRATARVANLRFRVRRRKGERELEARLPAGARSLDALACDGCGGATPRPALCDDKLHVLCEACVPSPQGRPRCRACERR